MKTHLTLSRFTLLNVSKVFLIPLVMLISSINLFAIHDLEVTGNITELGSDYLIVQGNTIYVDGSTEFRGPSNSTVTFSYFQLNDLVEVQADNNGNGTFLASRVKSEDGLNNENEVELIGLVFTQSHCNDWALEMVKKNIKIVIEEILFMKIFFTSLLIYFIIH